MEQPSERLRRIFCLTQAEWLQFAQRVRLYEVRDLWQMPCPLAGTGDDHAPIHLGWVHSTDPLLIVRAADLPRLCVLGAKAIAGMMDS